jgi:glutamate racemase
MKKIIKKIGIFDSGIGGLTILQPLLHSFPAEYLYLADTGFAPYGNKSTQEIFERTEQIIAFFEEQKVDLIIIACHTASAVIQGTLRSSIPVITILECALAQLPLGKNVAVLATELTVRMQPYKKAFAQQNKLIHEIACPNLASSIELYYPESNELILPALHEVTSSLSMADTILLGCTHYNTITPLIQNLFPQSTIIGIIDITTTIQNYGLACLTSSSCTLFTTSAPASFAQKANRFITNLPFCLPTQVEL